MYDNNTKDGKKENRNTLMYSVVYEVVYYLKIVYDKLNMHILNSRATTKK